MSNWTHYHLNRHNEVTLFELGECECCGGEVVEANAVKGNIADEQKYIRMGLQEYSGELPPEIDVDEDTGEGICDNCPDHGEDYYHDHGIHTIG